MPLVPCLPLVMMQATVATIRVEVEYSKRVCSGGRDEQGGVGGSEMRGSEQATQHNAQQVKVQGSHSAAVVLCYWAFTANTALKLN